MIMVAFYVHMLYYLSYYHEFLLIYVQAISIMCVLFINVDDDIAAITDVDDIAAITDVDDIAAITDVITLNHFRSEKESMLLLRDFNTMSALNRINNKDCAVLFVT